MGSDPVGIGSDFDYSCFAFFYYTIHANGGGFTSDFYEFHK